jgi:chromosome segregation ATPase
MRILDLLRGEKPPNPASLRGALADAEAERGAAVQALDRLQQRHAELLLDGDDRALDTLERDLAQVQRRADRLDLLIMQAQERLREAEAAERQAELDALFARGEALAAEGVELIKKQYPPLARKVLELAERLELIDREIAELNRRLAEAGDPRRVRDYDAEARPVEPAEPQPMPRRRFWAQVELPSSEEWHRMLLPTTTAYGRPLRPDEGRPER